MSYKARLLGCNVRPRNIRFLISFVFNVGPWLFQDILAGTYHCDGAEFAYLFWSL